MTSDLTRRINDLEEALETETENSLAAEDEDVRLHGLSKTLRILSGQTRRQARPEKLFLAVRVLLGMSMVEGNSIAMANTQVPEVLQNFLMNNKALSPGISEAVLRVLISLSSAPENHIRLAKSCLDCISKLLSQEQDPSITVLALQFITSVCSSYEVQLLVCDRPQILRFFVDSLSNRNTKDHLVYMILQLVFNMGPSMTEENHSGLSISEMSRMTFLPSERRMALCSLTALETIAVSLGIDPYQLKRDTLIQSLLKCRFPPVPSKLFEHEGLVDSMLGILSSQAGDSNKLLVCQILANFTLVPDNRLEIIYAPGEAAKRIIDKINESIHSAAEHLNTYKQGPPEQLLEEADTKSRDPTAHLRAAYSKRFDTVYEAWVYYDKAGNWIVAASDFELLTRSLSLGIPEAEILQYLDPRSTRFLDPHDFCSAVAWHELPDQSRKVAIARMLKETQPRRKQIVATATTRSKITAGPQLRSVLPFAKRLAMASTKKISQKSKGNILSLTDKTKSKRPPGEDESKGLDDLMNNINLNDEIADQTPSSQAKADAWRKECHNKITKFFSSLDNAFRCRLKLLLSTLLNTSYEIACHDILVLEYHILEIIEPCLFIENDDSGIYDAATQLWGKLGYILDENNLLLSDEQQRRIQQSVGKWQHAGLNAIFNTWKHVLVLLRVHQVSIPTSYRNACYELQVPSSAATAGTALRNFLSDAQCDSLVAANAGLSLHSAQALGCAMKGVSISGVKLHALNIVELREFERLAPLRIIDVSNNNIRDEGCAFLVSAIIEIRAKLVSINFCRNSLSELAGEQVAILIKAGHLEEVKLTGNKLGGKGIKSIATALETNSTLKLLDISRNVANAPAGSCLGRMLQANSTLRILDCSWNEISAENSDDFFEGVAKNKGLIELNASWNSHGKKSIFSIGSAIRDSSIESLDLSHIGLDTKDAIAIAEAIRDSSCIQRLNLSGNPIGPGGCRMVLRSANSACQFEGESSDNILEIELDNCGAVDSYEFNPAEPAGRYILDLSDPISHSIVQDLLFISSQRKGGFMVGSMKLGDENYVLPTANTIGGRILLPDSGFLQFRYVSTQKSITAMDLLNKAGFKRFKQSLSNTNVGWEDLNAVIDLHVGSDTFFSLNMIKELLRIPNLPSQTRTHLVVTAFHRMEGQDAGRELLAQLTSAERIIAESHLGHVSLDFCPRNPTGFYRLELSDEVQRSIALNLQRLTQDQAEFVMKRNQYYEKRMKGGPREELPSAWRNMKLNGNSINWTMDFKLPVSGTLEFDYVWLLKPKPEDTPMTEERFEELDKELGNIPASGDRLIYLRGVASNEYFTTHHILALLKQMHGKDHRTDLLVVTFARTYDFHGLSHLYNHWILPSEKSMLAYRIGISNVFDEVMAVSYYELHLSNPEERFIVQELLQLACNEPGENQIDTQYEGCDFQVPAPWIQDLPRKGLLQMFYCRESHIIKKVFSQGAFDHSKNPGWMGVHGVSDLCPEWLKPFCEPGTNQAFGSEWVQTAKLRLIKAKMQEKFATAGECFSSIDNHVQKDGSLSRAEWSAGLFGIGVWLHPNETKALFEVLDADGSGSIDFKEFEQFWNRF